MFIIRENGLGSSQSSRSCVLVEPSRGIDPNSVRRLDHRCLAMPVTPEVRAAELEIDNWIARLSYWYAPRDLLLSRLLEYYRDAIEVLFARMTHDVLFVRSSAIGAFGALEDRMRAGVFQALKWTMEFGQVRSRGRANLDPKGIHRLVKLGELYEVFVDVMSSAQADAVTVDLDSKSTCSRFIRDRI